MLWFGKRKTKRPIEDQISSLFGQAIKSLKLGQAKWSLDVNRRSAATVAVSGRIITVDWEAERGLGLLAVDNASVELTQRDMDEFERVLRVASEAERQRQTDIVGGSIVRMAALSPYPQSANLVRLVAAQDVHASIERRAVQAIEQALMNGSPKYERAKWFDAHRLEFMIGHHKVSVSVRFDGRPDWLLIDYTPAPWSFDLCAELFAMAHRKSMELSRERA